MRHFSICDTLSISSPNFLARDIAKLTPHSGILESCSASKVALWDAFAADDSSRMIDIIPTSRRMF